MPMAKIAERLIATCVYLRPDQLERLRLQSTEDGISLALLFRQALDFYFEHGPKAAPRARNFQEQYEESQRLLAHVLDDFQRLVGSMRSAEVSSQRLQRMARRATRAAKEKLLAADDNSTPEDPNEASMMLAAPEP
jgi:hypothetical protein